MLSATPKNKGISGKQHVMLSSSKNQTNIKCSSWSQLQHIFFPFHNWDGFNSNLVFAHPCSFSHLQYQQFYALLITLIKHFIISSQHSNGFNLCPQLRRRLALCDSQATLTAGLCCWRATIMISGISKEIESIVIAAAVGTR